MRKKDLETEIIQAATKLQPINGYGYKSFEDLRVAIAEVMGYEIEYKGFGFYRHKEIKNLEDYDKVHAIIDGMKKENIIKFSKSGSCFKMV